MTQKAYSGPDQWQIVQIALPENPGLMCVYGGRSKESIVILICLERVNLEIEFTQVKPVNSGMKCVCGGVLIDFNKGILF